MAQHRRSLCYYQANRIACRHSQNNNVCFMANVSFYREWYVWYYTEESLVLYIIKPGINRKYTKDISFQITKDDIDRFLESLTDDDRKCVALDGILLYAFYSGDCILGDEIDTVCIMETNSTYLDNSFLGKLYKSLLILFPPVI